ncbi:hypothetical protein CPter291_1317 [Collimonas pratensis]|uniref:Uncharacterized protein n=1 Tax=Collimonas pratensis TaxID=279113 RepID=A0A127Q0Z0_9BURK|nr:hypothetical protein CPter91_1316 [Collimonas pratensis]AMP13593.1 hypothetical protein CPter291_1317 [Collimonas pratensis]
MITALYKGLQTGVENSAAADCRLQLYILVFLNKNKTVSNSFFIF